MSEKESEIELNNAAQHNSEMGKEIVDKSENDAENNNEEETKAMTSGPYDQIMAPSTKIKRPQQQSRSRIQI